MNYCLGVVIASAAAIVPLLADEMPISNDYETRRADLSALYSQEILDNLDCIKHTFRIKYAPKDWKLLLAGWDLNAEIAKAKGKIEEAETVTLDDGRQILLQFMNSCCDYHVKAKFHSTAFSYLPFRVKGSQGRYFVSWIDEMLLWDRDLELEIGDEVLSFNDRPIDEVVSELQAAYFNRGKPSTDRALAEIALTLRIGADGLIPQQGNVSLKIQRRSKIKQGVLEWFCGAEEISPPFAEQLNASAKQKKNDLPDLLSAFHKSMKTPLYQSFVDVYERINRLRGSSQDIVDEDFFPLGNFKSYVPLLGKVLWKAPESTTFFAYCFEHPRSKRHIGYVRIPSFDVNEGQSIKEFSKLIREFEQETDALVIDLVCNPGGDLFFAYAIASMLSTTPLDLPTHAFTITQEDVRGALMFLDMLSYIDSEDIAKDEFGNSISGYNVDMDFVNGARKHFNFIIDQWNRGHQITDQFHLFGISATKPHRSSRYSKPILILIDNLDFSCADFLPAIMQDNQRATLFGSRTGGAGGYVNGYTYPNLFGLSYFTCTASFALRPGNIPLENLGASPDIAYEITPSDLQEGYKGYSKAVNRAIETLFFPID